MNITDLKKDEQRKNDFIGMISHELITPVTALSSYLQILQAKAKFAEDYFTARALDKACGQLKKMTAMIHSFLNLSRLESGKMTVNKYPFQFENLLQEMIEETELMHATHRIVLTPCDPILVNADQYKIGNVISNLLGNAIKYSPPTSLIEVKCKTGGNNLQLSVKDEGAGINTEYIEKIFDRYYRVDSNTKVPGFGIGLYLCAEIIRHRQGKIWVESKPGRGSTFHFKIPLQ